MKGIQESEAKASLLLNVASGDGDAVDLLYARYQPFVWSIVRGSVPHDAAEDVVQEVFINLWRNAGRFNPTMGSERSFVAMITRRRLTDRLRRDQRRGEIETLPDEPPVDSPDLEAVEIRDAAAQAEEGLAKLRPVERQVLQMSVSGFTHREISAKTEIPLGTVKSHARRGLERVRRMLKADEPEDEA